METEGMNFPLSQYMGQKKIRSAGAAENTCVADSRGFAPLSWTARGPAAVPGPENEPRNRTLLCMFCRFIRVKN